MVVDDRKKVTAAATSKVWSSGGIFRRCVTSKRHARAGPGVLVPW